MEQKIEKVFFSFIISCFSNSKPSSGTKRTLWICIWVCHLVFYLFIERLCAWDDMPMNSLSLMKKWLLFVNCLIFCAFLFQFFSFHSCLSWEKWTIIIWFVWSGHLLTVQYVIVWMLHNKHFALNKRKRGDVKDWMRIENSIHVFHWIDFFKNTLPFHYFN